MIKQHTRCWHMVKKNNFGANDIASLLGVGFEDPSRVITNKINGTADTTDVTTQQLMDRGTRYESGVRDLFKQRHSLDITETGLKRHSVHKFITASPDGFCLNEQKAFSIGPFLTEFKVLSELSAKIPMKYWVQMQVQMEVWNIPHCVYCENVVEERPDEDQQTHTLLWNDQTYHWQLVEFREYVVARDTDWWNSVLPKVCEYWSMVEAGRKHAQARTTRKRTAEQAGIETDRTPMTRKLMQHYEYLDNLDKLIQPYMLSNYFRGDPLLDWLNLYGPVEQRDTETNIFLTMMRNKNREFNKLVTEYITKRFPQHVYNVSQATIPDANIESQNAKLTFESLEQTKSAMRRKVPIIFNPCFMVSLPSYPYPFGGRADMIVLNRYASELFDIEEPGDDPEDAYTIVSFRYATINLRADKTYLLNNAKQKVYKAHMWLLNSALGVQQKHVPSRGYIIGRKYDFTKKGTTYRITNAFKGIGTVEFEQGGVDENYETECREALEWLQQVKTPEASTWDPFKPDSMSRRLCPNMKNMSDHPWREYKRKIASAIKEITLMPHCGPNIRNYAHEQGVTAWRDLTPDAIRYNRGKLLDRIMTFVEINTGSEPSEPSEPSEFPDHSIQQISTKGYIRGRPCVEFFLDFESIGNMYDDFSQFPEASDKAMIFLIGLIIVDNVAKSSRYVSYLINKLDHDSERQMITRMLTDIKEARERYQDFSPIYFWSNAENYMLKRAMGPDIVRSHSLCMIDLCKAFRECNLIIPGQMGYGLKDVASRMHHYGMIPTTWTNAYGASPMGGLNAMVKAIKNYGTAEGTEGMEQCFSKLIEYNYVDCKVMEEILEYLRSQAGQE